jgi:hypothetical protein
MAELAALAAEGEKMLGSSLGGGGGGAIPVGGGGGDAAAVQAAVGHRPEALLSLEFYRGRTGW